MYCCPQKSPYIPFNLFIVAATTRGVEWAGAFLHQPIRVLPLPSTNHTSELCIILESDWSWMPYKALVHALTFKRGKIVVSFTLDGVDYLGDYHVKNVIFVRRPPPFLSTTLLQSSAHFSASLCVVHMHTNNECVCVCVEVLSSQEPKHFTQVLMLLHIEKGECVSIRLD